DVRALIGDVAELERHYTGEVVVVLREGRVGENFQCRALRIFERQGLANARSDVVPPLALDASLVQLRGDLGKITAGCDLERQPRGAGGIAALESDRLQSGFGGEDCAILFARDQA